jgi:hypothetical protein
MFTGTRDFPGIVARVAVQLNFFAVAQAKSFTLSATKCQTSRVPTAVACPAPTSLVPTIVRTSSDSST